MNDTNNELNPPSSRSLDRPGTPASSGWGVTVVLALITAGFSVINPALLIFVPFAFLLLAMPPRRSMLVLVGAVLLAITFFGQRGGTLWWFGRGWVLILSGWFVVTLALLPDRSLTMRALTAIGGAAASVALLFLVNRTGWQNVDWTVAQQLRDGAADMRAFWAGRLEGKAWASDVSTAFDRFADWQAAGYPAMLAIASLAGLALSWWLWRRLVMQDPRPFGALRDFRFSDHLIWIAIVGIVFVVAPFNAPITRTGANLLAFMGALYSLRGFAVMLWLFGTPGILGALFGAIVFLMLYPIVMVTTLMVGVTDTWLDLRARQNHEKS